MRSAAGVPLLAAALHSQEAAPVRGRSTAAAGLDGNRLPFSRFGSYWAVSKRWLFDSSKEIPGGRWYLRLLADDVNPNELFELRLQTTAAANIHFEPQLTPAKLTLEGSGGAHVQFAIGEGDVLRIRGRGCRLHLRGIKGSYGYAIEHGLKTWEMMADVLMPRVQVSMLRGKLAVTAPWLDEKHKASCLSIAMDLEAAESDGEFECALQYYDATPRQNLPNTSFTEVEQTAQQEFERWRDALPALPAELATSKTVAAYVLWSSTVAPRGFYRTPVVWCSKSWMNRIWSWDHCFVAVGLSASHPALAWEQFSLFRDMQDPASGMCADWFSNVRRSWLCTKPPVHGWALRQLIENPGSRVSTQQLEQVYEPLRKWTQFWITERNLDGDGLPYILNPNESFDNTTANTLSAPVKAPEIAAYLILQLETMALLAERLGQSDDAQHWRAKAHATLSMLLQKLWDERHGKFRAVRLGDGKSGEGDCLFSFVPLILGNRLPVPVRAQMVRGIATPGRFLSPYGLATEALTSPRYDEESYVKGPVWAPPNVFITQGLDQVGEHTLAGQIRNSFVQACRAQGMSEHFSARTGEAQGDPGYNWTAAMFLHFSAYRA